MGVLFEGTALTWEEIEKLAPWVRRKALEHLLKLFEGLKNRTGDPLKWGDELEYMLIKFDHENHRAKIEWVKFFKNFTNFLKQCIIGSV